MNYQHNDGGRKAAGFKGTAGDCGARAMVIARQAHHFVAVLDGVAIDSWDCTKRMVYGYWAKQ